MLDANTDFNDRNLAENEEVIMKTINYLKYKDPANANRDYAIGLLKRMQAVAKTLADGSKLDFEEFIDQNIQSQKD
jgi:hypothetical protein